MDLATIIGVAVSTLLVVAAILMGGEPIIFFDPSSPWQNWSFSDGG
ncbi:MAG: hypothetical protein WD733_25360 [Bryobacterales bacterium]